jgi:hypothetical protein
MKLAALNTQLIGKFDECTNKFLLLKKVEKLQAHISDEQTSQMEDTWIQSSRRDMHLADPTLDSFGKKTVATAAVKGTAQNSPTAKPCTDSAKNQGPSAETVANVAGSRTNQTCAKEERNQMQPGLFGGVFEGSAITLLPEVISVFRLITDLLINHGK